MMFSVILRRAMRGFTLIELMVVIALVAILASMAVPSYRSFLINQQLSSASSDFLVSMMQARSEALRLGQTVALVPADGANWSSGWYLSTMNNSCSMTGTAFGRRDAISEMVTIQTATSTNSFVFATPSFTYSPAGFPFLCPSSSSYYNSGTMNGRLVFQATETGRAKQVIVSLAGRARICDPSRETCTAD
jgi:type IV fimbrial biogenesis protein FimT